MLLAAIGLAALWQEIPPRWHYAAAALATLLLLYPWAERAHIWQTMPGGRKNLAAYAGEQQSLDAAVNAVKERGGRAYSGLAASWGGKFKTGDVPFYAFLSKANVPAAAFLYHSMAVTDTMVRLTSQPQPTGSSISAPW